MKYMDGKVVDSTEYSFPVKNKPATILPQPGFSGHHSLMGSQPTLSLYEPALDATTGYKY